MPSFVLVPQGPFSLTHAADVVRRFPPLRHQPRSKEAVRVGFVLDGRHCSVAVSLREERGQIRVFYAGTREADAVARQVARIFSLDHDATGWPALAERDPKLGAVMDAFPGLRPVCFTSPYECACWAIIAQRITTSHAARVVAELVRAHGEVVRLEDESIGVFPRPDRLLDVTTIPSLPLVKVDRLHAIARAALDGKLDAERLRRLGDELGPQSLRFLPGIGPFWASAIYLRACGIRDVFPDEPITIAALGTLHELGAPPPRPAIERLTEPYRPYRMWVAFLLRVAAARGIIGDVSGRAAEIRASAAATRAGRRPGLRAAVPRWSAADTETS